MADWKEKITEASNVRTVSLAAAKKFFAVDVSGSTHGRIIEVEGQLVQNLSLNSADTVCRWDSKCDESPQVVSKLLQKSYWSSRGGTRPEVILEQPSALNHIRSSDIWLLLTDGEISNREVASLTNRASSLSLMNIPIVLVIVSDGTMESPKATNISIAIPFFAGASNAVILFKDARSGELFVVAAKGCFRALWPHGDSFNNDLADWSCLPNFADEHMFTTRCESLRISIVRSQDRQGLRGISLGPTYTSATGCTINVDALLEQSRVNPQDLRDLLEEEAFRNLAIVCKTRGYLGKLQSFLIRHKRQVVAVQLEDHHGAGKIMRRMETVDLGLEQMNLLRTQLRAAHVSNRSAYTQIVESPNEEARIATEFNRLINDALAWMAGIEKASYTAEILGRKSNRAMRADKLQASDADLHLLAMNLSDEVDAFRSACCICAGDNEIMSIVLKRLDTAEDNTTDFALNFPLAAGCNARNVDLVSSQCICFQCALLCKKSIFQEELAAIIPTIEYTGSNKRYLKHQLCLAITTGLNTGASGIAQIFMTILDRVLETKDWCRAEIVEANGEAIDQEKIVRRQAFDWMLRTVLRGCMTRETFTEVGPWIPYPQALKWAFKDYEQTGLDSWIIQYPVSGFCQIIRWYGMIDEPLDSSSVECLIKAKLIHLIVSSMMNALLQHEGKAKDRQWTHPFMSLIYRGFNAPGIPRDIIDGNSIVSARRFWPTLEGVLGGWPDVKRFLSVFPAKARRDVCRRIQLAVFWAIFTQQAHTTPKTFFHTIAEREPSASVVLGKPKDLANDVPEAQVIEFLTSIFRANASQKDVIHGDGKYLPFASAFGASVLRCGFEGCNVRFYDPASATTPDANTVRQRRAQHLAKVFGGEDFACNTGLPEPTRAPKAPTSAHCNLHRSVARVWSRLDRTHKYNNGLLRRAFATSNGLPSKQDVYDGNERAITAFVSEVRVETCVHNGRGDIYRPLETGIRALLPSFLQALRLASGRLVLDSAVDYVHDWTQNSLEAKIQYEMSLGAV